ncbi:MAG TPA: YicC/YloC family endoribonuclease [Terriglobales bacterium]|nr:YicC/YloC family endoribonuclease [Terriglobales bacterium]
MKVRSMTGFAQVKEQVTDQLSFTLSLKSVNHRFLDLHLRMPPDSDALEMKLRRLLKEKIARGHVDLILNVQRTAATAIGINTELVAGYVQAFRDAAREFAVNSEPDLNAIFKLPGALEGSNAGGIEPELEAGIIAKVEEVVARLNEMRAEEGASIEREMRDLLKRVQHSVDEIEKHRTAVLNAYMEKIRTRMQELVGAHADQERILQESALLAERSDIREEIVRMHTHIKHFAGLLDQGVEIGKKLDFLLQEMNREANTLLSKTTGVAGEALRITELGLALKSEIEKAREQVQNIE